MAAMGAIASMIKHRGRTACGALLLVFIAALALSSPALAPLNTALSPLYLDLSKANLPPGSPGHFLGTDFLGRDVLAYALWGARASLCVGIIAAFTAVAFGSLWGALSALLGGAIDMAMMRFVDGLLSVPSIILLLVLQSLVSAEVLAKTLSPGVLSLLQVNAYSTGLLPFVTVIAVIAATSWLEAARLAYAQVQKIKSQEYVTAARAIGAGTSRLLFSHLLPNCAFVLIVEACLLISDAVLMEAGLSFLGLGLGPQIPSWGSMLACGQESLISGNWWAAFIPGALISLTVLAVTLLGEGFQDAIRTPFPQATGRPGL